MSLDTIAWKFKALAPVLDERARRLWAAAEARSLGHGGITAVSRATGMSRVTITAGIKELTSPVAADASAPPRGAKVRRPGGGRKSKAEVEPKLVEALDALIE